MPTIQPIRKQVNGHTCGKFPPQGTLKNQQIPVPETCCPKPLLEGQWRQWGWVSVLKTPDTVQDCFCQASHTARTCLDKPLFHAAFKAVGGTGNIHWNPTLPSCRLEGGIASPLALQTVKPQRFVGHHRPTFTDPCGTQTRRCLKPFHARTQFLASKNALSQRE